MKRIVIAAALGMWTAILLSGAHASSCAMNNVRKLQMRDLEAGFRSKFCSRKSAYCDAMWNNAQLLIQQMFADQRIGQVEVAAYMFATALVETGNLSPARKEVIGVVNQDRDYVDPINKIQYFGRGWSQITRIDRYRLAGQILHIDLEHNPDLALQPNISYEILFLGMRDGWFEVFRDTPMGGSDGTKKTPTRMQDFINQDKVDYKHARAIINANCHKTANRCTAPDIEYLPGLYIPDEMDAWNQAATAATKFQKLVCDTANRR